MWSVRKENQPGDEVHDGEHVLLLVLSLGAIVLCNTAVCAVGRQGKAKGRGGVRRGARAGGGQSVFADETRA